MTDRFRETGLLLEDLTWPEVRDLLPRVDLVLIPVGATEQHGPNLALKMDIATCAEFCRRASMQLAPRVLVAPAVPWGISLHHMHFPGTISLDPETFIQVLVEIIDSLQQHGFERFLIVNGHGGNMAAIDLAAVRVKQELEVGFVGACSYWSFIDPGVLDRHEADELPGHASEFETSAALYLMPEIVRTEALAVGDVTTLATDLRHVLKRFGVTVPYAFEEYTANGALGDARRATAAFGKDAIDGAVATFCGFVERLLASPFSGGGRAIGGRS